MMNLRVSSLALSVFAGGVMSAAAQSAGPFYTDNFRAMDYTLHEVFPGAPRFAYTAGLPTMTTAPEMETLSGAVATDGRGRIDGLVYARVYFGGPFNHSNNYSSFTMTVIGNTNNRGTNPLVKLNLRGNGYYFDGLTNHPNASISINFNSTNQLVDVPPLTLTIGGTTFTNSRFTTLSGTMKGNIQMGKNGGPQVKVNGTAALITAGTSWSTVDGTNGVENAFGGGLVLDVFTNIDAQVLQPVPNASRLYLNAWAGSHEDLLQGTGSANYGGSHWNASFSGIAFTRGCTLQANGTLGPAIVAYQPTSDTNFPSGYIPLLATNVIQNMTITGGKFYGQKMPSINNVGYSIWPSAPTNSVTLGL